MTKNEAVKQLTLAFKNALNADPAVGAAVRDLSKAGLTIVDLAINLRTLPIPEESQAEYDAAFLRNLRIDPDMSISKGVRDGFSRP